MPPRQRRHRVATHPQAGVAPRLVTIACPPDTFPSHVPPLAPLSVALPAVARSTSVPPSWSTHRRAHVTFDPGPQTSSVDPARHVTGECAAASSSTLSRTSLSWALVAAATSPPRFPVQCHACHAALTGMDYAAAPPQLIMVCHVCQMTNVGPPRLLHHVSPPPPPPSPPPHAAAPPAPDVCTASLRRAPLMSVIDFAYGSTRVTVEGDVVAVCRGSEVVTLLPRPLAALLRTATLRFWQSRCPAATLFEADATALVVALVAAAATDGTMSDRLKAWEAVALTSPFAGSDVLFQPWCSPSPPHFMTAVRAPSARIHETASLAPTASPWTPLSDPRLPLDAGAFDACLTPLGHPHAAAIAHGVRFGFPLLSHPPVSTRLHGRYTPLDSCAERVIHENFLAEVASGAMVDVTSEAAAGAGASTPSAPVVRYAPVFTVPKPLGTPPFRVIHDFSAGQDSVNAHTHRAAMGKPRLTSVSRICRRINWLRQQRPEATVVCVKLDITAAYRNVPVAIRDRWMLAHRSRSLTVVHAALPFGAESSVNIMTLCSTASLEDFLALRHGIFAPLYIDDALLVAYADEVDTQLTIVKQLFIALGWPLNLAKLTSPATTVTFLGVQLDTVSQDAGIAPERVATLTARLRTLLDSAPRSLIELSPSAAARLAGSLSWCASVFPLARAFLRCLWDIAARRGPRSNGVDTAYAMRVAADLQWWVDHLSGLARPASFAPTRWQDRVHAVIATDACKRGWGIHSLVDNQYACGEWLPFERRLFTTAHWEAAAALLAVTWWCQQRLLSYTAAAEALATPSPAPSHTLPPVSVLLLTDSHATARTFNAASAHDARLATLLRCLVSWQIVANVTLHTLHVSGTSNVVADALSRHLAFPSQLLTDGTRPPHPLIPSLERPRRVKIAARSPRALHRLPSTVTDGGTVPSRSPSPQSRALVTPLLAQWTFGVGTAPKSATHHRYRHTWTLSKTQPCLADLSSLPAISSTAFPILTRPLSPTM